MFNDRLWILCRHDDYNLRDSLLPASCCACRFRLQHAARGREIFENPLAQAPGVMNVNELLALFVTGDCIKNLFFSLDAKAFDAAHLAGLAPGAQPLDPGNSQLFLKTSDFLN